MLSVKTFQLYIAFKVELRWITIRDSFKGLGINRQLL